MTGIVLAGGRSTRFGRDKLLEPVHGEPLLWRPIRMLATLTDEVVVATAPGRRYPLPPDVHKLVRFAEDVRPDTGPVEGLRVGLEAASHPRAVVVAGDMPSLSPAELRRLLAALDNAAAAVFGPPLPCAMRAADARDALPRVVGTSLRAFLIALNAVELPLGDAATLRDIDTPADLPLA